MENRIIKFKFWDNIDYMSNPVTLEDIQSNKIQFTSDAVKLQFTGLLDKNGIDIYEGDMLKDDRNHGDFSDDVGVVEFQNGMFGYKNYGDFEPLECEFIEVIGNVFENRDPTRL